MDTLLIHRTDHLYINQSINQSLLLSHFVHLTH